MAAIIFVMKLLSTGKPKLHLLYRLLSLLHISLQISYENLVLDQDSDFYLISLIILITCLLNNVWIL